jgi:hypothetical protein
VRLLPRLLAPLAVTASLSLVVTSVPAWAAPTAPHQVPFPCGETWTGSTRAGHSPSKKAVDFNRNPDEGAPVVASAPGIVTTAQATTKGGYGRWVVIDHGNSESTLYAHLSTVTVGLGQRVDQGMMIGTVGNTGNSRGAHLHYEQKSGRSVVDAWFAGMAYKYGAIKSANCVDVPMAGNFVGDRVAEVAVFRRAKRSTFVVNVPGAAPMNIRFGRAFEEPLLGDWNGDGQVDVGVRNPRRSIFRLKTPAGITKIKFGLKSDTPVSGDWNGDGITDVGVRRPSEGTFWLRMPDGSSAPVWIGDGDDLPVTGDWDGDGRTDLGVFDQATATFTLRTVDAQGGSLITVRQLGVPGDFPVAGDWDGDGRTDLGVWTPSTGVFTQAPGIVAGSARTPLRTVKFGRARR